MTIYHLDWNRKIFKNYCMEPLHDVTVQTSFSLKMRVQIRADS